MTVYQHIIPGMQAEAADMFSRLLHGEEVGEHQDGDEDPPDAAGARTPAA